MFGICHHKTDAVKNDYFEHVPNLEKAKEDTDLKETKVEAEFGLPLMINSKYHFDFSLKFPSSMLTLNHSST